jgi:hypothetical protein
MIVKRLILKKILNSGFVAEFLLIKSDGQYEAALFLNGKQVKGPPLPMLLTSPKDDLTHWMGNRPARARRVSGNMKAEMLESIRA